MSKVIWTDIVVLLDRSGSMFSVKQDMEGGFNEFIKNQKEVKGKATVSLYQFDTEYDIVYENKDIKDVPALELIPRGGTALLDALHKTVASTKERLNKSNKKPNKCVIVVITDGYENSSKEVNRVQVMELITRTSKNDKIDFVYLGANQDAIRESARLGINLGVNYHSTPKGSKTLFQVLGNSMTSYRSAHNTNYSISDTDRQKLQKEDE